MNDSFNGMSFIEMHSPKQDDDRLPRPHAGAQSADVTRDRRWRETGHVAELNLVEDGHLATHVAKTRP